MLTNVRRWCQRVESGAAFYTGVTIVCTATMLYVVWLAATWHEPLAAAGTAILTTAVSSWNWYRIGKQRGASVSLEQKGTVGR